MTLIHVKTAAVNLQKRMAVAEKAKADLVSAIDHFCERNPGNSIALASLLEFSVAYISDIRHGRRKLSDAVVEKIAGMK